MLRTLVLISCLFYAAYSIKCNQYIKGKVDGQETDHSVGIQECDCKFCLLVSIAEKGHLQLAGCGCANEANSAFLKKLGYDQRTARTMVEAMTCTSRPVRSLPTIFRTLVLISCLFYAAYSIKCNQYLKGTVNGNEVALSEGTSECDCKFCLLMTGIDKNNHGQLAGCGCTDEGDSAALKKLGYDQRTARMLVEAMTCRRTGSTTYDVNGATSTMTCCDTAACN